MNLRGTTRAATSLLLAGALVIPPPSGSKHRPRITYFTGTEVTVQIIDFGEWSFPNGNLRVRGLIREMHEEASDDRITGNSIVEVNANINSSGYGRLWGTYTSYSVIEGGSWEGTWVGRVRPDGSQSIRGHGRGKGIFKGQRSSFWTEYPAITDPNQQETGDLRGFIYESRRR